MAAVGVSSPAPDRPLVAEEPSTSRPATKTTALGSSSKPVTMSSTPVKMIRGRRRVRALRASRPMPMTGNRAGSRPPPDARSHHGLLSPPDGQRKLLPRLYITVRFVAFDVGDVPDTFPAALRARSGRVPRRTGTPAGGLRPGPALHSGGLHAAQLVLEFLDLVAEPRGQLELQLSGRGVHLLGQLGDEADQVLAGGPALAGTQLPL